MSSFLLNLARRAAGLPVSSIQAPMPSLPGPDARAPDPDANEAATETPPVSPAESWAVTPAVTRTTGEALPQPATQRSAAMAEPMPPPSRLPMRMAVESGRLTETAAPARTVEAAGAREPAPLTEQAALVTMPPPRPPLQTEREPARHVALRGAAPRPIAEPSTAMVSDLEPALTSDDVLDVLGWGEGPAAPVAEVAEQRGLRTMPLVATAVDRPQTSPVIRPAAADSPAPRRLPAAALAAAPARATPPPVHVRIGRVEVRGTPAPAPRPPSSPAAPATFGFAGYTRVRTYRNWPR